MNLPGLPRPASVDRNACENGARSFRAKVDRPSSPGQKKSPAEISIVDDDPEARFYLKEIMENSGEYCCVGSYGDADEALSEIPRVRPRLVFMDIHLPGKSGIECAQSLKSTMPGLMIVFVSGLMDAVTVSEALDAGGDEFLTKPYTVAQCLAMTQCVFHRNEANGQVSSRSQAASFAPYLQFTDREIAVMECLANGLLYKEIEGHLNLSCSVLKKLQHGIYLKLGAGNRTEAVRRWLKPVAPSTWLK